MRLTPREVDTVLAALRMWQRRAQRVQESPGENGPWLTPEEIDDLCERVNTGEAAKE